MERDDGYFVESMESRRQDREFVKVWGMNKSPCALEEFWNHVVGTYLGDWIQLVDKHSTHQPEQEGLLLCGKQSPRMTNYMLDNSLSVYPMYISKRQEDGEIMQERY